MAFDVDAAIRLSMDCDQRHTNMIAEINKLKGRRDNTLESIANVNAKINKMNQESNDSKMVQNVLDEVGKQSRATAKAIFEKVVTDALQFSTRKSIKFIIEELGTRSKPSYEFYIETETMGVVSKKNITSGGYMDICSNVLSASYYELFKDPVIMNSSMLLDEPGKMISQEIDIRFAEYVKFIGKQFNRQPIMITHKDALSVVADKYWHVDNVNGVAVVTEQNTATYDINKITEETEKLIQDGYTETHEN